MQFIRQLYDNLPDFIPIPAELKHSRSHYFAFRITSIKLEKIYAEIIVG